MGTSSYITIEICFGDPHDPELGTTERFTFNDLETADAFMMGVASAIGWDRYRTVTDTRGEFTAGEDA